MLLNEEIDDDGYLKLIEIFFFGYKLVFLNGNVNNDRNKDLLGENKNWMSELKFKDLYCECYIGLGFKFINSLNDIVEIVF